MAATETTLLALNNANFRTSRVADDLNTKLMSILGLKSRYEPARLAIARSLSLPEPPPALPQADEEESGKVILGVQLFGDDLPLWVSMIIEKAELNNITTKDLQEEVRRHWHRGILLLHDEWKRCGEDFDKFIVQVAGRAGVKEESSRPLIGESRQPGRVFVPKAAAPIILAIGDPSLDMSTNQPVTWLLNGRGNSPHIAIMGTLGTGKTQAAKHMIRQVCNQAGCPILLFDIKGDLSSDPKDPTFASDIGAQIITAPQNPIPLDVLFIPEQTPTEITNAAVRFRDSFQRVTQTRPGGAQLDALREGAQHAFREKRPVRITDVRDWVKEVYTAKKRKDDTVIATFNDLTSWELFSPTYSPAEFFSHSWIINVKEATETAQRLVIFLVLDALYSYFRSLPDSEIDDKGHRAMRLVVGIDEARRVLGYDQPSLISLVRESRSKGVSIFLISQSPDDYNAEDENFLENIGLAICFQTNALSPRALNAWLGQSIDLGALPKGVAVTRLPGHRGIVRIKVWTENGTGT